MHMDLNMLRRRLSGDEINAMPLCHYQGPVHVIRVLEDWKQALPDLRADGVLGFDTETRPTFRKGKVNAPSLIQLATERAVYLVQLAWLPFGPHLARFSPIQTSSRPVWASATTCVSSPAARL